MKLIIGIVTVLLTINAWSLTVTSLNTQWYGRGGILEGSPQDEYRDERIYEFLTKSIPASDVIVFQEVTDVARISKLFYNLKCASYGTERAAHQHIVICVKPNLYVSSEVEEAVRVKKFGLRPGMIVNIFDGVGAEVSIVGLHLKARQAHTELRLQQVQALANSKLIGKKAILIGDFNTFDRRATDRELDDFEYMSLILKPFNYVLSENESNTYTYLSYARHTLDRVWSRGVNINSHKVYGPCREGSVADPFSNVGFFRRFVSDHCAIQVTVE